MIQVYCPVENANHQEPDQRCEVKQLPKRGAGSLLEESIFAPYDIQTSYEMTLLMPSTNCGFPPFEG